jgi:hypothetical protein
MNRSIGGPLDLDARSRLHRPQHAWALDDARDHLRRACSALAASQPPDPVQAGEIARMHARLADELVAIETIGKRP